MDNKEKISFSNEIQKELSNIEQIINEELGAEAKNRPDWTKEIVEKMKNDYKEKISGIKEAIKQNKSNEIASELDILRETAEEMRRMKEIREKAAEE